MAVVGWNCFLFKFLLVFHFTPLRHSRQHTQCGDASIIPEGDVGFSVVPHHDALTFLQLIPCNNVLEDESVGLPYNLRLCVETCFDAGNDGACPRDFIGSYHRILVRVGPE